MTSTSCNPTVFNSAALPVAALEYPEVGFGPPELFADPSTAELGSAQQSPAKASMSDEELALRLQQTSAEASARTAELLRREHEKKLEEERARLSETIASFEQERAAYYAQVEPELVHLILAVAEKILHREAQVDRMLVAALAKVAVENLQQRSHVVLRVSPERCAAWREYFASQLAGTNVEVLEDSQLDGNGCVLETELGTANIGISAQLKEIERGFFDLLAKRPEPR